LIVRAERLRVERVGSGSPVRGARGTLGADVVVVVGSVVVEDVVVVEESAKAIGANAQEDPTPMITAKVRERRIRATYFAPCRSFVSLRMRTPFKGGQHE
jgi:hypothetical protein